MWRLGHNAAFLRDTCTASSQSLSCLNCVRNSTLRLSLELWKFGFGHSVLSWCLAHSFARFRVMMEAQFVATRLLKLSIIRCCLRTWDVYYTVESSWPSQATLGSLLERTPFTVMDARSCRTHAKPVEERSWYKRAFQVLQLGAFHFVRYWQATKATIETTTNNRLPRKSWILPVRGTIVTKGGLVVSLFANSSYLE